MESYPDMNNILGKRLAQARKQARLQQADLVVAMGDRYDQEAVSAVERGRNSLRLDGLVKAARELEVSTDWLLGLTDDPTPATQRGGWNVTQSSGGGCSS